jgi:ribonuclease HI
MIGHFDGSCAPKNPGGTARFGWTLEGDDGLWIEGSGIIGSGEGMTNNVAEAVAAHELMKWVLLAPPPKEIYIYGDSAIVIQQLRFPHKKQPKGLYAPYIEGAKLAAEELRRRCRVIFVHIPREQNEKADKLSKGD